jgi:hypothetical protein
MAMDVSFTQFWLLVPSCIRRAGFASLIVVKRELSKITDGNSISFNKERYDVR